MASLVRILSLGLVALLLGCGPGSTPVEVPQMSPAEEIRRDLQTIVETGQTGSEMVLIEQNIDKLQQADPDKAAQLSTEFQKLQGSNGPQAQAQAKKMLEML